MISDCSGMNLRVLERIAGAADDRKQGEVKSSFIFVLEKGRTHLRRAHLPAAHDTSSRN